MQGGDKLCGLAPAYSSSLKRLCQACDVAGKDAGDPNIICQHRISSKIEILVQQKNHLQLQALNQYCIPNAWFKVDYGGCSNGILVQHVL